MREIRCEKKRDCVLVSMFGRASESERENRWRREIESEKERRNRRETESEKEREP